MLIRIHPGPRVYRQFKRSRIQAVIAQQPIPQTDLPSRRLQVELTMAGYNLVRPAKVMAAPA